MDPSIDAVDYVLNGYRQPLNKLSPDQWHLIINETLDNIGSKLKYMPHIRDLYDVVSKIQEWRLYDVAGGPVSKRIAWKAGFKHWSVEEGVRLIPLGFVTIVPPKPRILDAGRTETMQTDVHLFLSTKRQWIKMERIFVEYQRRESVCGYEEFLFCGLNKEELLELIGDKLIIWPQILIHLQQLAFVGIHQKRRHIEVLEAAAGSLAEVKSRVGSAS